MNTFLKRLLLLLFVFAVGLFLYSSFVENIFDKRASPKDIVRYEMNDLKLEVFYNRPSKKNREIFGALIPYDKVWRTGANEATTFKTNKNLYIKDQLLPAQSYTLWTIPNDTVWQVIFNSKEYPWGVDEQMQPMRDPAYDYLIVDVPVEHINSVVEQFTIAFDNITDSLKLTLVWDKTKVEIPLNYKNPPIL